MPRSRRDSFVDFRASALEDVPADVLAMYRVYAEGVSVAEVAERFGRPARRVRALFHDCGLPVARTAARQRLAVLPSEAELRRATEEERAWEERQQHEAAERERQERRAAKAAERLERAMPRIRAMYARYEAGATLAEVGAEFGVSESRVSQLFQRVNLPTRAPAQQTNHFT